LCLNLRKDADEYVGEIIETGDFKIKVTAEMAEHIQLYLDTIREDMARDCVPQEYLQVEKKFTLENVDKKLYGTNDASYINPFGMLRVYDFKYGQGQYVEVEDNTQLLIYDLGAWVENGQPDSTEIIIVQPRYISEDVPKVRRKEYTGDDLALFSQTLITAIKRVNKKDKTTKTGEWCKFCPAMAICPAKQTQITDVVPSVTLPDPADMSIEQLMQVMFISDVISEWSASVHAHAESLAKSGVDIPGYKLVPKRANRRWIDEMAVETAFESEYGDELYTKKLKSPAQLEKVVGKEMIADYVEVPDNGVQLVPETAKSKAVTANPEQVFKKLEVK
jgi:hypothetical protein